MPDLEFTAAPTCARFMKNESFGRLIAGPVGSGKTTACIIELLRRAMQQEPGQDGLRYTRFAIVRQTLKQLKDTVLKDCRQWLAQLGEYRVSENTFYINFQDVRSELIFIPLENAEDQARLLSMQLTAAWLSEAIEMDISVVAPLSGRCGRYPSATRGAPSWFGLIADTNFPSEGSPWHKFMIEPLPEWAIFTQPSGLSDQAENLAYLQQTTDTIKLDPDDPLRAAQGRRYYQRFVDMYGLDSDWVKRYVKAEYGDDPSGTAVFRHCFTRAFHTVPEVIPIPGYPILIAQDFGRDPWSLICQVDHMGRLLVFEEVPAEDTGLESHIRNSLLPRIAQEKYQGMRFAVVGDPAGVARSNISEESCFDAIKRMGLKAFPAPTNDLDPRLRAVEALLLRQSGGGPVLMISQVGCPTLIRGLDGGYRFAKTKTGQTRPKPDKNDFSHVCDALQYAALCASGGYINFISSRLVVNTRVRKPAPNFRGWT